MEHNNSARWIVVDLNSYFASVEQEMNPRLRGRPVAVVPMKTDSTCCIAASYEAKRFGVKTGTLVGEARKMCPGIIFIEGDHRKYIEYHHRIVEAIESCHPVSAVMSIDEMACRLGGRDQQHKLALELGREIKNKILQVGSQLTSSVGIAPNRFLAKTASDFKKPDGLTLFTPDDLPHILYTLKLRDLCGIGSRMERRLHEHKIFTVEQLCNQSPEMMRKIWGGVGGDYFYRWLRGEDFLLEHESNKSIGHSHVLAPELRNQAKAYAVAQKLLHKTGVRLRRYGSWAQNLSLSVRYTSGQRWKQDVKMLECQDDLSLREILKQLWRQQLHMGSPMKVGITLTNLLLDSNRSFSFFENTKGNQLSTALDELNERYGKNTIYFGGTKAVQGAAPTRIAFTNIPELDDSTD